MTDIPAALVEKAAEVINRWRPYGMRVPAKELAEYILAAVWPDVAAARPVVDREALAKALCRFWDEDLVENDASSHSYGAPFPCPPCTAEADAILASGVVTDVADVRRQTAEDIAAAIAQEAVGVPPTWESALGAAARKRRDRALKRAHLDGPGEEDG